jgi:hypothetical protein
MQLDSAKRIIQHPFFMLSIVVAAFLVAFLSVLSIQIEQMGTDSLFVFQVIPPQFWISACVIACMLFFMIPRLGEKRFKLIFVFSAIILIIAFRMAFPVSFTTVAAYEPDSINYMNIVGSWANHGVDLGVEKNYQHDYPLSFLTGYAFVKLGVPLDSFFRIAPFVIYALDIILLFLIIRQITPEKYKNSVPAVSVLLFSFSSLGYWVSVHYCPDLFGSLMYLLSFYMIIRFASTGSIWSIKSLLPVFLCIFLLLLSHHLSTLYLIITLLGFAIATWFFKPPQFAKGALSFFILAIFTYTLWFVYGSLVYPSFFNVYIYFSGYDSIPQLTVSAGWLNNAAFVVYPLFIIVLFTVEFLRTVHVGNPLMFIRNIRQKLGEIKVLHSSNSLLVFTTGFCLIFLLFFIGFSVPVLFGTRILEIVCIGLYPLASQTLIKLADTNSKKKKAFVLLIIVLIVFVGMYRYYTQTQRRIVS